MEFSAVSSALKTIGELTQEVMSLWGVDEQVQGLANELRWMQSFLKVADARRVDHEVIRTSVVEIRELAYDAEDAIETFSLKVASKRKDGFSNCIKRSDCFLKEGCLLHQIKSEIEKITVRIKELTRQLKTYDVSKLGADGIGPSSSTERRESRRSYPHVMDDNIVGLDKDIKKLVSVLVNEGSECRVLSICGMGVWEDILSDRTILSEADKKMKVENLAEKLSSFLEKNKCLVILDDIWNTEAWDSLKPAFSARETRSKILLTSRNKEIVSHADRKGFLYELQCLNYEQSWELFQKIAFPPTNSLEDYEIPVDRLIQLWVAEGIVSSKLEEGDEGQIEEDVAERYLMEFVERCMIQVRERDVATLKMRSFQMHDLMRDVCLSKAKQEKFLYIANQSNACQLATSGRVRRVSVHKLFPIQCIKSPCLRSLLFFDAFLPDEELEKILLLTMLRYYYNHEDEFFNPLVWKYMFNNFNFLRVLDYERGGVAGGKLPNNIGKLIHLRFLRLKDLNFWCSKLPSSLGNLRCLQTLDLRIIGKWSNSIHVPNVIWRMEKLRHLYLPNKCSRKTKLKLGTLRNLQTLVNFNTKNCI
ncbi:putative disease resistance RPP8-like protein 2 [Gossypium australe]|uniref:Putative disease resistance RPP8-like protein 2 n=1 Tax=Gossypium australe TaxID=47621 RepID=A0A5B6VTQ4_9ROSI|nr:putative disease resistance RPP8-like protein 2 [Gossypium australe]